MSGASLSERTGNLSWWATRIYLVILILAALAAAAYTLRFWTRRGPYFELLAQARGTDWRAFLWVATPILLGAAAIVGAVVVVFAFKRRFWSVLAAVAAAPATIGALYLGATVLRDVEGVYYQNSHYVALYRTAAFPLAALSLLFLVVLVLDLLVVTRRRPAASAGGT